MAKYCPNCGTENVDTAMACSNCGVQFAPAAQPAPAVQPAQPGVAQPVVAGEKSDGCGIASFVCSIVGILCCSFASIAALICGIISQNNIKAGKVSAKNKWMSIAGIIMGAVGIAIWIFNIIVQFMSY